MIWKHQYHNIVTIRMELNANELPKVWDVGTKMTTKPSVFFAAVFVLAVQDDDNDV